MAVPIPRVGGAGSRNTAGGGRGDPNDAGRQRAGDHIAADAFRGTAPSRHVKLLVSRLT